MTTATGYRIPIIEGDAGVAWIAEGAEILATDAEFDEIVVNARRIGGLSIISRELAEDSEPSAQATVGEGLTEKIARGVDSDSPSAPHVRVVVASYAHVGGSSAPRGRGMPRRPRRRTSQA